MRAWTALWPDGYRVAVMPRATPPRPRACERLFAVGLKLPGTTRETRYDGSPVLRVNGYFVAGIASHRLAEPGSIVVRCALDDREWLLSEAPDTYYVTDYHRPHPVVLARLAALGDDALRDLLSASWRLTMMKTASRRMGWRCPDPNGPGLPTWPAFREPERSYLKLGGSSPAVKQGLRRAQCDLFIKNTRRAR